MGAALDADPEAALAYTDAWVLDDRTRRIRRTTAMAGTGGPDDPPRDPRAFLALLVRGNFVYGGVTARRSVVEEVGGFDESLRALEDYDLWLRLVSRGHIVIRLPEVLAVYRHRLGAMSNDDRLITASLRDLCARLATSAALSPQDRAVARARVAGYDEALAALPGETAASSGGTRLSDREGPGLRRRVKRLLWRREWFPQPPPDVHAAFPDLGRV
jgi:GT2 family glycosyltransferase